MIQIAKGNLCASVFCHHAASSLIKFYIFRGLTSVTSNQINAPARLPCWKVPFWWTPEMGRVAALIKVGCGQGLIWFFGASKSNLTRRQCEERHFPRHRTVLHQRRCWQEGRLCHQVQLEKRTVHSVHSRSSGRQQDRIITPIKDITKLIKAP